MSGLWDDFSKNDPLGLVQLFVKEEKKVMLTHTFCMCECVWTVIQDVKLEVIRQTGLDKTNHV